MEFLVVVIAIVFLQMWGADNPLHRDEWMVRWLGYLERDYSRTTTHFFVVAVGAPMLLVLAACYFITSAWSWLALPFGVVVLLYSFGRGEFSSIVNEYTKACYIEDWDSAVERAQGLGVETDDVEAGQWSELHQHVLDEAGYRGFERMFAVFFWFLVLGPVGAVLYRVLFLFNTQTDHQNARAAYCLWLMEWPAVRILGLSFAVTGNFVGCFLHWRESLLCFKRPTPKILSQSIIGALSVDEALTQTCEVTRKELELLDRLYTRTLWLWLGAAALPILLA